MSNKLFPVILIFSFLINIFSPQIIKSEEYENKNNKNIIEEAYLISDNIFFTFNSPSFSQKITAQENLSPIISAKPIKKEKVILTAYSSTYFECDGNPFRTASGTSTRDGIIATNFLPFGTKIKIPEIFGDKIFVVEDRMAKRYWKTVDIWMPTYEEALNFGVKYAEIEILP